MKKITLALLLLSSFSVLFAQSPQKMSYQSVIRKTDGTLVADALVNIKISILLGSATGTASYVETQNATTNTNGLATIEIGGGTPVIGTFAGINWGAGSHFIKTEIDPTGGSNYTISGTSQLLSVPYALYAGSTQNQGKTSIILTGDITDAQAAAQIKAEYGPYTENIYVTSTTNLTTLDLSDLKSILNINLIDNANLGSINFNNLVNVYNQLRIERNDKLVSIVFPALTRINDASTRISNNSSLLSVSFPVLAKVSAILIVYNSKLSSIDLPSLTYAANSEASLNFSNNKLSSSQVNLILSRMLNVSSPSIKYIQVQGQTPPAPPTGQGITDKATLINMGNDVRTD